MTIHDDRTERGYPLPHPENNGKTVDVGRLREALGIIDAEMTQYGRQAVIDAMLAAASPLTMASVTATAEPDGDNERRSAWEIFDAGGARDFPAKSVAELWLIRPNIKTIRVDGLKYRRATSTEAAAYSAFGKLRSLDKTLPDGGSDPATGGWWVFAELSFSGLLPGADVQQTADVMRLCGAFWVIPYGLTATVRVPSQAATVQAALGIVARWCTLAAAKKRILIEDARITTSDIHYIDDSWGRQLYIDSAAASPSYTPGFSALAPLTIATTPVAPFEHPDGPAHPYDAPLGGIEWFMPLASTDGLVAGDLLHVAFTTGDDGAGGADYEHLRLRGWNKIRALVPGGVLLLNTDIVAAWNPAARLLTATVRRPAVQIQFQSLNFTAGSEFYGFFVKQALGGTRGIVLRGDGRRTSSNGLGVHDGAFMSSNYEYPTNSIDLFGCYGWKRCAAFFLRNSVSDMPYATAGACGSNGWNTLLGAQADLVEGIAGGCVGPGFVAVDGAILNASQSTSVGSPTGYQANNRALIQASGARAWSNVSAAFFATSDGKINAEGTSGAPTIAGRSSTLFSATRRGSISINANRVALFAGVGGECSPALNVIGASGACVYDTNPGSVAQVAGFLRDRWKQVVAIPTTAAGARSTGVVLTRTGIPASVFEVRIYTPNGAPTFGTRYWGIAAADQVTIYFDNGTAASISGFNVTLSINVEW